MLYLTTHSTQFIYGYMASDIWLRTILIVREETRCRHMGYSFRLAARVVLWKEGNVFLTHFIYGYMVSGIWHRTTQIAREETRCRHMGYSFRLAARVVLYAPSHRQDSTYHGLCYTNRGALAGTRRTCARARVCVSVCLSVYICISVFLYLYFRHQITL